MSLERILGELKRRRVFRVTAAYIVGAVAVSGAADVMLPRLLLPDWTVSLVVGLAVLGLPIAVSLAWAFDITPEGVQRTSSGKTDQGEVAGMPSGSIPTPRVWIAGSVILAAIAVGVVYLPALRETPDGSGGGTAYRSVAVLPFADLSPAGAHAYLAESVAEELLTALQHVPGLRVPASAASFQFRGRQTDPRVVGDTLNVDALLDGSVRFAGERLGLDVQLVETEDGSLVWSEEFELRPVDLWSVEEEIARRVIDALGRTGDVEGLRLVPGGTEVPEAMDAYLAYLQVGSGDIQGRRQEIAHLEAAVAADSTFARAWSSLAREYMSAVNFYVVDQAEGFGRARAALDRALALAPGMFEARMTRARLMTQTGNSADAEAVYQSVLEQNPNAAEARVQLSRVVMGLGRSTEAVEQARLAIELDPLGAGGFVALGRVLVGLGEWDAAYEAARRAWSINPAAFTPIAIQSVVHTQRGDHERAIELATEVVERFADDADALVVLSYAQLQAGEPRVAEESLLTVSGPTEEVPRARPTAAGTLSGLLGRPDDAFEWYARAVNEERSVLVSILQHYGWPWFDPIRDDPRFAEVLARIGLRLPAVGL